MLADHIYANARRDELWRIGQAGATLLEQRLDSGHSYTTTRGGRLHISASSDFNSRFTAELTSPEEIEERLHDRINPSGAEAILTSLGAARVDGEARLVSSARYVENHQRNHLGHSTTATIRRVTGNRMVSITTDPTHVIRDLSELVAMAPAEVHTDYRGQFIFWRNGSGALLLHEAIGHPAERDLFTEWPSWLMVSDEPAQEIDDTAQSVSGRELSRRQRPAALRRSDFRSVPVRRMTNLVVSSSGPDAEAPDPRIEVTHVSEGAFDPVGDLVRLQVSRAILVNGTERRELHPFIFAEPRTNVARKLAGAIGPQQRYPGTICSEDGQRMPVGSVTPDLLTAPFK